MAQDICTFLQWLIVYAISHGFWHFVAVLLIVRAIGGFTTLIRVELKPERRRTKAEVKRDGE